MSFMIQLTNVGFAVKHPAHDILKNIDLQISAGEFVIILGSNGSGKSSLLKLLDRRYHPTCGQILLQDKKITTYSPIGFAKLLISLTQNPLESLFSSLTVEENCLLALSHSREKKFTDKKTLKSYLADFNPNLPHHFKNLVDSLSGGEQQAFALALAGLASPKILLLDEHTSALDPHAADRLMVITDQLVKRLGITCLLTTHNLDIATQYGSRILALQAGKIMRDYNNEEKHKLSTEDLRAFCY